MRPKLFSRVKEERNFNQQPVTDIYRQRIVVEHTNYTKNHFEQKEFGGNHKKLLCSSQTSSSANFKGCCYISWIENFFGLPSHGL